MIRLRRDSMRPLCFNGHLIARYNGWLPHAKFWHDISLYRINDGGFAVAIVARIDDQPDVGRARAVSCYAARLDTLDAALSALETYDVAFDLCPGMVAPDLDAATPVLSTTALRLEAAALRDSCRDIVSRYKLGAGTLMYMACKSGL